MESFSSPVLVFQEGDLSSFQYEKIVLSTTRPVAFPIVDFQHSFPRSFDAKLHLKSTNSSTIEEDLGYKQMLQFWISGKSFSNVNYTCINFLIRYIEA